MPRGRPRKQKQVIVKNECNDLFKLISDLLKRELTDDESAAIAKSCFTFVKDNYTPTQVYTDDVLKEEVINNGIVGKNDFDYEEDEDYDNMDGKGHGWGKQFVSEYQGDDD